MQKVLTVQKGITVQKVLTVQKGITVQKVLTVQKGITVQKVITVQKGITVGMQLILGPNLTLMIDGWNDKLSTNVALGTCHYLAGEERATIWGGKGHNFLPS